MFGKRSSGPQAKTKSVEQADAIDAPLEKVELSKEKLTEIQATAAESSKPTQLPPASTGSKIQKQSAQKESAADNVELFGDDKIEMLNHHNEGDQVDVSFNLSSREYNGRYFHNIDAWRIENIGTGGTDEIDEAPEFNAPATEEDDLPF